MPCYESEEGVKGTQKGKYDQVHSEFPYHFQALISVGGTLADSLSTAGVLTVQRRSTAVTERET